MHVNIDFLGTKVAVFIHSTAESRHYHLPKGVTTHPNKLVL